MPRLEGIGMVLSIVACKGVEWIRLAQN